jgi:hypothetical protein
MPAMPLLTRAFGPYDQDYQAPNTSGRDDTEQLHKEL